MLPLDAVRVGDALVLAGREGTSKGDAVWLDLAPGIQGRLAAGWERGPIGWDPEAPAEGLAPLSLYEHGEYLARVPVGASWDPQLAGAVSPVSAALGEAGLFVLTFRGRAGGAWLTAARGGEALFGLAVEVRTRKIDYVTDFRAMLDGLGEVRWGEALTLEGALTTIPLEPVATHGGGSWEAFLRLRYLSRSGVLARAVETIRRAPVVHLRAARRVVPTERATWVRPEDIASRAGPFGPGGFPATVPEFAPAATLDTPENRFVVHALEGMKARAESLAAGEAPLEAAAKELAAEFGSLRDGLFEGRVGPLSAGASMASTALQRRPGYREVLAAWLLATDESVATRWTGSGLLREGVRDTARVYERWCALQVGRAAGVPERDLVALLAGEVVHALVGGAALTLRTQASYGGAGGSYSLAFRPDLTLEASGLLLHLDAKYQMERTSDVLGPADDLTGAHPRSGVVKMHAYRDAIAGTWGAYIVYPGSEGDPVLFAAAGSRGGVGALPLRPGADSAVRRRQRAALEDLVRRFVAASGQGSVGDR